MEEGLIHLFHAFVISIVLYMVMRFFLQQSQKMSINRSLFIGSIALIYMILFGHGLPTHINKI